VGLVWRRSSPRAEEFRLLGEELVRLMDEAPRPPGPRPPGFRAGKR
jgi:hypothetical protein